MSKKLLVCQCGDISHQLIIQTDDDGDVIVSINLTCFSFWRRLIHGIKYIFGFKSQYGDFEEIILDKNNAADLQNVVDFLNSSQRTAIGETERS